MSKISNSKKILATAFIGLSICASSAFAVATNVQSLDFNYKISGKGNPSWKPIEVFTTNGRTYIKYADVTGAHDLPDLYLKSKGSSTPQWKWEAPYVVVNEAIDSAQIVNPHTGKVVYTIAPKENALPYIAPAPSISSKKLAGVFVEFDLGVGGVNNQRFKNPVFSGSIGYDADVSSHVLLGLGIGGTYNGKSNQESPTNKTKIRSFDIELMGRATYLFYSGFTIFGKAGLAYTIDKLIDTPAGFTGAKQQKKIVPKMALGVGYQTTMGLGFNFQLSRLFDSNTTANASALTVGMGYHF